jgi:hypothetical protein
VSLVRFSEERASVAGERTHTGLRDDAAIARYVQRAVSLLRGNPDAAPRDFARLLAAAANVELNRLGVPDMSVAVDGSTHRGHVVTEGEAAGIAMAVWHEARHAEQRFRIAAGEWRESRTREDAIYEEAVTAWLGEVEAGARLARAVTACDGPAPEQVRERTGRMLAGWSQPGGAMDVIRSQLLSARRRRRATIVADVHTMVARFDAAEAEWRAVGPSPSRWAFVNLAEALRELLRAIDTAHRNQPLEKDAHEAGRATFDAFHAELARPLVSSAGEQIPGECTITRSGAIDSLTRPEIGFNQTRNRAAESEAQGL